MKLQEDGQHQLGNKPKEVNQNDLSPDFELGPSQQMTKSIMRDESNFDKEVDQQYMKQQELR